MRLFVSVDLPDAFAEPIAELQSEFAGASGLSFTDPEQAHVTMAFLGETDPDRVGTIADALDRAVAGADVGPFKTTYEGLGVFPSIEYITVVWLGVGEGTEAFRTLQAPIESAMADLSFEPDDHEFTPHVTLARMEHAGGKELVQEQVQEREPTVGSTTVETVRLTESTLTPDGPEYETVHEVGL